MKKHNFSAGPAILPDEVFRQAAAAVLNFENMDLSILEISHRSKQFQAVVDEAEDLLRSLIGLSNDYAVVFMPGGASSQFFLSAMNFLNKEDTVAYINTGTWSTKAIKEAKSFGKVVLAGSSEDHHFNYIPKNLEIPEEAVYLHYTSNNTIYGTQFQRLPDTNKPLVCDMSSDFLSKPIAYEKYGLIYAGAQKNVGPAGVTVAIVRKDWLEKHDANLPTMLKYKTYVDKGSMFNTPPVFPIYVSMLTLRWIAQNGGLEGMKKRNELKADLLYSEIDRNTIFRGTARKEDRSLMNAVFVMQPEIEHLADEFLAFTESKNISGLKGHRSVGGFRASIYNSMELNSIEALIDAMQEFESKKG